MKKISVFLFLFLAVLAGLLPLLIFTDLFPAKDDVDYMLGSYEAVRRTILDYGEFPFWNPWWHGGIPLFANPQIAVFGLETVCSLIFGVFYGLRVAIVLYLEFAAFGMFLLLGDYTRNVAARFYGAVLFVSAGCFAVHLVNGHFVFLGFAFLPWMVWLLHRIGRAWYYAAGLGLAGGMLLNHNVHYSTMFVLCTTAVLALPPFLKHMRTRLFWKRILLAGAVLLATDGYRLVVSGGFILEYPRVMTERYVIPFSSVAAALTVPFHEMVYSTAGWLDSPTRPLWGWHEIGCYVGVIALSFVVFSMIARIRWYHGAILLTALLAFNTASRFLPGYWLRELPPFTSCFVFTRWRFVLLFFLCVAAACGITALLRTAARRDAPRRRIVLLALMTVSLCFTTANQIYVFHFAVPLKTEREMLSTNATRPAGTDFVTMVWPAEKLYAGVRNNIGNLSGYEPSLGYSHIPRYRFFPHGHPSYGGEFESPHAVRTHWSPNRIDFRADGAGPVRINANTGNYWRGDGRKLFPGHRAFEEAGRFVVNIPDAGLYSVKTIPPLHEFGFYLSLISGLFACLLIFSELRSVRPESPRRS